MKKILINAMMLRKQNTGLGVYACEVLSLLLPELIKTYDITLLCESKESLEERLDISAIRCIEIKKSSAVARELAVARFIYPNARTYDLVYSMSQHGFPCLKTNTIITVHDIMPRLYPKRRFHQYLYYILYLPLILKRAQFVITGSINTQKDLSKYYSCKRVTVAPSGIRFSKGQMLAVQWSGSRKKQYIIIGVHYPYKNIHSVIDIFISNSKFVDRELIIIGNADNSYGRQLKRQVKKGKAENRIFFTEYISEAEKEKYLSDAYALIYPTKYEGFGLPVLEGMVHGIPVACSNTSSLPEVVGDAAIMFDPENLDDMAAKILMLDDEAYSKQLIKKGYENIKRFTWQNCAEKVLDVIENVLK